MIPFIAAGLAFLGAGALLSGCAPEETPEGDGLPPNLDGDADGYVGDDKRGSLSVTDLKKIESGEAKLNGRILQLGDCNDLTAAINPSRPEEPYNNVDEDCDGTKENDVDNDGFPGWPADATNFDCADEDASINPSATEINDNDIDENCDTVLGTSPVETDVPVDTDTGDTDDTLVVGDTDDTQDTAIVAPTDNDQDGYTVADDCDDNNRSIHPGATEVPYDGIDQNCDAYDLTDVDGDGHDAVAVGGDDFNDADARLHPGAIDIPYDGIDQDGVDGDLTDVDGDGYASTAVVGGDDCDDANFFTNPGVLECFDGEDNDCDGSTTQMIEDMDAALYTRSDVLPEDNVEMALCDVNGDGFDDLIVGDPFTSNAQGQIVGSVTVTYGNSSFFPNQGASLSPQPIDDADIFLQGIVGGEIGGKSVCLGDLDGDGKKDLATVVAGATSKNILFYDLDNAEGLPVYEINDASISLLSGATFVSDTTGDSFQDSLGNTIFTSEPLTSDFVPRLCMTRGGMAVMQCVPTTCTTHDNRYVGDIVLMDEPDTLNYMDTFPGSTFHIDASKADFDGDGLADLVGGNTSAINGGAVLLYGQTTPLPDPFDINSFVPAGVNHYIIMKGSDRLHNVTTGDFDGDGQSDFVGSDNGRVYVISGDTLANLNRVYVQTNGNEVYTTQGELGPRLNNVRSVIIDGAQHGTWFGAVTNTGDTNGDGISDLSLVSTPDGEIIRFNGNPNFFTGTNPFKVVATSTADEVVSSDMGLLYNLGQSGDVDGDGADEVPVYTNDGTISVLHGANSN